MAGQPDITSILAALAAQQRPVGTPSHAPPAQQQLPPGYLGAQQAPAPSMPSYGYPQPTSSGSVDLSSVRPISTGSVTINDAIAKARSIAAERGVQYPAAANSMRDDPRLAGRGYRRSRSRSRSPQRRDAFRDNFNPYRDERRDDRRGGGYGRSPSPNRRRRESLSPAPGRSAGAFGGGNVGGGGSGGGDSNLETIFVKSALVGLIIGRQGENLRRVEQQTGARVQFVPAKEPNAAQRQCTISGPLPAREAAKQEIFQVMEENGGNGNVPDVRPPGGRQPGPPQDQRQTSQPALREGENSRQILVPDKTVGLIIGRGGETIRDLQERSGCHVNIVGENKSINGKRPVNLIGSNEAASVAEKMIWEIVQSDTRAPGGQGPPPARDAGGRASFDPYGGGGGGGGRGDDGKSNESIQVPSEAVGMIIGKGGETIKEMQNATGCKINVNQPSGSDIQRQIDLVGSGAAIENAKRAIWEKVDTVQQRDRQGGRGGGRENDYGDRYSQQQQQPSYSQPPQAAQGMPGMPQGGAPVGGDPNAPDPYAAYGGYQNYVALWYAALQQQQQGGQPAAPQ